MLSAKGKRSCYCFKAFDITFGDQTYDSESQSGCSTNWATVQVRFKRAFSLRCWFVLGSYGRVNTIRSFWAWSVYLTTLLLGRHSPLNGSPVLCTFFCQKLTTALLDSVEGENIWCSISQRKNVTNPAGVEPATPWSPVGRASEPS